MRACHFPTFQLLINFYFIRNSIVVYINHVKAVTVNRTRFTLIFSSYPRATLPVSPSTSDITRLLGDRLEWHVHRYIIMAARSCQSTQAVFSTPELLESILLHLDMADLLVAAQQVCKGWHDIMKASPAIRQALYFDAAPVPDSAARDNIQASKTTINPLLAKRFSPCFFDFGKPKDYFRRANSFYSMSWVEHPRQEVRPYEDKDWTCAMPLYPELDPERPNDRADRRRFTTAGTSWRRMLVSQPPPLHLGYIKGDESTEWPVHAAFWCAEATLNSNAAAPGLRMGELYDLVQHQATFHDRNSLWFRLHWQKAQGPFYSEMAEHRCEEMLCHTSLVVEFMELDDVYAGLLRDPADESVFESWFRCDDFEKASFKTKTEPFEDTTPTGAGNSRGFDLSAAVF